MTTTLWFSLAAISVLVFVIQEALRERRERNRLKTSLQNETAARLRATAAQEQANRILQATHHELNREITLMGFAVDDLVEENPQLNLTEVLGTYAKLEEGRDNVAALAQLGTDSTTTHHRDVVAKDLLVLTNGMRIHARDSIDAVQGDRLLLRTLVKNVARNAETHGGASELTIDIDQGMLTLVDNGSGCTQEQIERAWEDGTRPDGSTGDGMQIIRQIADAHGADVRVSSASGDGVKVEVIFANGTQGVRNAQPASRTPFSLK